MSIDHEKLILEPTKKFVISNGKKYKINSDFRSILKIIRAAENGAPLSDCMPIFFKSASPADGEEIMISFIGKEYLPSHNSAFSFYYDAGLIIGAFAECYGIDLSKAKLHWHMFTALFMSLSESCAFSRIIKLRCTSFNDPEKRLAARRITDKYRLCQKEVKT